ncbi:SDR family NAD(P)-dependent oxidoreductase [Microbispora siamensis]
MPDAHVQRRLQVGEPAGGRAAFLLTGLVAPAMAARGRGAIVNMGSINSLFGTDGSALYSMTKARSTR